MCAMSTMNEIPLSIHDTKMTFTTNSPELAHSVESFLRYFKCETLTTQRMLMQFDAVHRRSDIPVRISPEAQLLHSGSGLVIGRDCPAALNASMALGSSTVNATSMALTGQACGVSVAADSVI